MIVSTSDNRDPAKIKLRMLSTDSLSMVHLLLGEVGVKFGRLSQQATLSSHRDGIWHLQLNPRADNLNR